MSDEFKATWNQIHNTPRVYTPADTAIQTPNCDTPYSFVGMDLRAEPIVLTVPPIDKGRYFRRPAHRRLHFQLCVYRQPRHRQRWRFAAGKVTSGDVFGTREYLKNNYLYRMAAAVLGIYGNSKLEAMYPFYAVDETKQKLDGANRYAMRFAPDQLPPVNAFWSLTMYEMPKSLLGPIRSTTTCSTHPCCRSSSAMRTAG